eukprot:TRINITY_DN35455_c0_g1_i1.p2 TRINITY_DN35455_c0_g1~~TRINITY_DN35455_c0_g1_i1.p2  ORF type:complete len:332 (+),score=-31.39 TRINITY_DN35455_c0_g1_i1:311-1306(+)
MDERNLIPVDLPERRLQVLKRGIHKKEQGLPLFILEKVPERVDLCPELLLHEVYQERDIVLLYGGFEMIFHLGKGRVTGKRPDPANELIGAEVNYTVFESVLFTGDLRPECQRPDNQPCLPGFRYLVRFSQFGIAPDGNGFRIFNQKRESVIKKDPLLVDNRSPDIIPVDGCAIPVSGQVALCLDQVRHEERLKIDSRYLLCQLHGPAGVLHHLDRFYTGDVVKEPAAGSVHEQGMPLHLKKPEHQDLLLPGKSPCGMPEKELFPGFRGPVQDDCNIVVPCCPGIPYKPGHPGFIEGDEFIPEPVHGFPQPPSPSLVPGGGGFINGFLCIS